MEVFLLVECFLHTSNFFGNEDGFVDLEVPDLPDADKMAEFYPSSSSQIEDPLSSKYLRVI